MKILLSALLQISCENEQTHSAVFPISATVYLQKEISSYHQC